MGVVKCRGEAYGLADEGASDRKQADGGLPGQKFSVFERFDSQGVQQARRGRLTPGATACRGGCVSWSASWLPSTEPTENAS